MSVNPWRISGGLGVAEVTEFTEDIPVMLQGIGFPLRPVDNVPSEDQPDITGVVAEGLFMQWMGNFEQGLYYPKGAQVRDTGFIMIANKLTLDNAAPQPIGDSSFSQPTFTPVTNSNTSIILGGQIYTFTSGGWIKLIRVWVPALSDTNISYRLLVVVDPVGAGNLRTTVMNVVPTLIDGWQTIALVDTSVAIGGELSILLETTNSGASTSILGGWMYQGATQTGAPFAQNWTVDNQRLSFRIDKTDLDGTDRGTELEGVIPNSTILVAQTDDLARTSEYRVGDVVDQGTYMLYLVTLINETGGGPVAGAVTSLDIEIPIPLASEYSEQTGVWPAGDPSWATVISKLEFSGVDQGVTTSGFGVDIEFQPADVSPDWDIVTVP